jgi:hypothetical protein
MLAAKNIRYYERDDIFVKIFIISSSDADLVTLKLIRLQRTQKPRGIHGRFDDGKQTRTLILPFLPNFSLKRSHRMLEEKLKSYYRNWGLVYIRENEKPGD